MPQATEQSKRQRANVAIAEHIWGTDRKEKVQWVKNQLQAAKWWYGLCQRYGTAIVFLMEPELGRRYVYHSTLRPRTNLRYYEKVHETQRSTNHSLLSIYG